MKNLLLILSLPVVTPPDDIPIFSNSAFLSSFEMFILHGKFNLVTFVYSPK